MKKMFFPVLVTGLLLSLATSRTNAQAIVRPAIVVRPAVRPAVVVRPAFRPPAVVVRRPPVVVLRRPPVVSLVRPMRPIVVYR